MRPIFIEPRIPTRPLHWSPLVEQLQHILPHETVYLVGGIVRDVYLGRNVHDIDLVSVGDGRRIARQIANALRGDYYPLDEERGVGRALVFSEGETWTIDVAQLRGENLWSDLRDRDFTLNAMAVDLQDLDHLLDPLQGMEALEQKILALCNPHSITQDPVRALRGVRMSLTFQLRITPETKTALKSAGDHLTAVSAERIRDEFFKILALPKVTSAIQLLDILGLLPVILPEVLALKGISQSPPHVYDVWGHTLNAVDFMGRVLKLFSTQRNDQDASNFALGMIALNLSHLRADLEAYLDKPHPYGRSQRGLLVLAALLHDIGKATTRTVDSDGRIRFFNHEVVGADMIPTIGARLRLSNEEVDRLKLILKHHLRPKLLHQAGKLTRRAIYRYWRALGEGGLDVGLLSMADFLATYVTQLPHTAWLGYMELQRTLLEGYYIQRQELIEFKPLVSGHVLMETLNLSSGPLIGKLLAGLHEAQAMQEIQTVDEAIAWAKTWLQTPME